jgi:integrase
MDTTNTKPRRARGTGRLYQQYAGGYFWTRTYHGGKPIERSTKTKNRREAEAILRKHLREAPDDTPRELRRLDCTALFEDLVTDYDINGRKSLTHLELRWRLHLRPEFGDLLAAKVETAHVIAYVAKRLKEGAENATLRRELSILRRMFSLAVENKKLKADAAPFIKMPKENNTRKGFLSSKDQDALAQACGRVGLWMRAIFEVGVTLGWRYREVVDMRVRHVDLSAGTVRLDVGSTKNGQGRECPMMPQVRSLLTQCISGKEPDDAVFSYDDGRPVIDIRKTWRKVCIEAKVPNLLFHDLRRTAARNLRNAGIAEEIIMKIGGWQTNSVSGIRSSTRTTCPTPWRSSNGSGKPRERCGQSRQSRSRRSRSLGRSEITNRW